MTDRIGSATSRRALFAGAGAIGVAGVLAACGGGDDGNPSGGNDTTPTGGAPGDPPNGAPDGAVAKTSDIPVGGGKIVGDQGVVITQPAAGEFVGFTAICTHQQCVLASVSGGTINCGCHGSKFAIADGAVVNGPATERLPKRDLTIDGEDIKLA